MAGRRQIAVVDIDGVLADVRHRLHFVRRTPKDWDGFFEAATRDAPLQEGLDTARRLADVYEVVYLSGRPERCRDDTAAWFAEHGVPAGLLLLRPEGDRRPARVVKVEILRRLSQDAEVVVLVDDDEQVGAAARAAGFDVLTATWMPEDRDERRTLRAAQEREGRT